MHSHLFHTSSSGAASGFVRTGFLTRHNDYPRYYCEIDKDRSDDFRKVHCYDVEVELSKSSKSLFIICHSMNDKWAFRKNIGRMLEFERESYLPSESQPTTRLWKNMQSYLFASRSAYSWVLYCKKQVQLSSLNAHIMLPRFDTSKPEEEKTYDLDIDDKTIMASALEQIKSLNKEVVELKGRISKSLERMADMERRNG